MVAMPAPAAPPAAPNPPAGSGARGTRRSILWLSVLTVFTALATIGIITYLGVHLGPLALGVGIAGAILPVPVLVGCFLWLDRYQPSPLWLVVITFLWGAGVATGGALAINTAAAKALPDAVVACITAPATEETL